MANDLLIFQGADYTGLHVRQISLDLEPGLAITGPQKAAQKFMIMLLTRLNSIPSDPEFGTTFLNEITNSTETSNVIAAFNSAASRVINEKFLNVPNPDERVVSAELVNYFIVNDYLDLQVQLNYESGTNLNINIPTVKV